ncbi:MAG: GntR family transcriptional regulator [Bacilli bacterium]|nr:GntR family transcriptional regulator [Bacilli bacterium]
MEFKFDNEKPIFIQVKEKLRLYILSGYLKVGEKLPSVRELALISKVNPNTIQKALGELELEKLIYTERTNGKFVTTNKILIENIRQEFVKNIVDNYFNSMKEIGIDKKSSIKYLQERSNKNDIRS